jgi:3-phosphoshikimate 1-carboxyvinyltransferase
MTSGILADLGVYVIFQENAVRVFPKKELKGEVTVESDWSAASFWYGMLSMAEKGELFFPGLKKSGLQGDQQVAVYFRQLGVETFEENNGIRIIRGQKTSGIFHADFTGYPDLALPVILACGAAGIRGSFTGLERLHIKESDRLDALADGLHKAGMAFHEEFPGTWQLTGHPADPAEIYINDREDHRVAMTFAGLALKGFSVNLEHPEVVNKSYPGFWKDLAAAGFTISTSC